MARRRRFARSPVAEVTCDPDEALQRVVAGSPVVLVGPDAEMLGGVLRSLPDRDRRERFLAVLVGDPSDPEVLEAAAEMAGELWPWAEGGAAAETVS